KLVPGQAGDAAVITPDTSAAGSYSESLSFSAIDENDSGYFSSISGATLTVTEKIVSTPPAPVLTNVVGQPVNGGKIEVQGGGEAGDTLTLYEGTKQVGSGTVAADGTFDIITTSTFTDGTHPLTATETDAIKRVSAASAGLSVAVDPGAPTLAGVVGQPVNGGTIEVKGSGEAGDKVALFEGTTQVGSGTVAGNGAFDVTTTDTFGDGLHALTATETDAANLTSAASNNLFVYAPDDGAGTITDFAAAAGDKIDLTAFTDIHSFAAVLSSATESNGNTVLDFGNGDTLTLDGIAKASLSVNDFANLASPRGDFNGDGMSDLLWQNDNGRFSIWEMNGTSVITNPTLKVNPGPSWHAIGTGDFN
ncbi:MAG TPA: Ig-like domain-containing protein, partial [Thermomicrobiales bacterium]|nr:Ig-like domain-containing protein [Thermomicrobiales bacterium]